MVRAAGVYGGLPFPPHQMLYKVIETWETSLYNPQAIINAVQVNTCYISSYPGLHIHHALQHSFLVPCMEKVSPLYATVGRPRY